QTPGSDDGDLEQRRGPAKVVERITELLIASLDEAEDVQVALVVALRRVSAGALDLGEDTLAEALECYRMELSEDLPIRLFNLPHRDRRLHVRRASAR